MLSDELIKKLKSDSYFQQYMEYVIVQIVKLNSVEDLQNSSVKKAGETAKARAMAIKMLEKIISPFTDFYEKTAPSEKDILDSKNRFGL